MARSAQRDAVTIGSPARDSYRFIILGVVWSVYLVVTMSRTCLGVLAPFLVTSFGLSNTQVGWLASAATITVLPTTLLGGLVADRFGVRRALLFGVFATAACVGAIAFATSYTMLLALLALSGLGSGFIWPTAIKALTMWFPTKERATATGVMQTALNVGGIVAATTLPALALALGWHIGFAVAALLAFAAGCAIYLLYRDPAPAATQATMPGDATSPSVDAMPDSSPLPSPPADAKHATKSWNGMLALVTSREVLLIGCGMLFINAAEFTMLTYLVLYLTNIWAYSAVAAGSLLALCQFAGFIAKPSSGLVSDRVLGSRRVPALVALCALTVGGCALLAVNAFGETWLLYITLVVLGAGATGWAGLFAALAGEVGGSSRAGTSVGASATLGGIGIFVGQPLFGAIVDRTGSYAPAWWMLAAAAAIAAVLFALVREPNARRGRRHESLVGEQRSGRHFLPGQL